MDSLVFIVDLNEVDDDVVTASMDFTVNYGPFVRAQGPLPQVDDVVRIHYDEDDTLFYATVVAVVSDRDFTVRIDWDSCAPVLSREWSARPADAHEWITRSPTAPDHEESAENRTVEV